MEKIIKKAVEGGYIPSFSLRTREIEFYGANAGRLEKDGEETIHGESVWNFKDNGSSFGISHSETVCDSAFWQALGNVCRWDDNLPSCSLDREKKGNCPYCHGWIKNGITFHEINLTKGWDAAVAYLESITK